MMTTSPSPDRRPDTAWRRPALSCLASLGVVLAALVVVVVGTALEQAAHPPTCHGFGWGCTPDAATTAVLLGMFVGAPALVVAWALTWTGWALTRDRGVRVNRAAAWWPAWLLATLGTVLAVLAAATAG